MNAQRHWVTPVGDQNLCTKQNGPPSAKKAIVLKRNGSLDEKKGSEFSSHPLRYTRSKIETRCETATPRVRKIGIILQLYTTDFSKRFVAIQTSVNCGHDDVHNSFFAKKHLRPLFPSDLMAKLLTAKRVGTVPRSQNGFYSA